MPDLRAGGLLDGEVVFRNRCHGNGTNLLGPGKSIVFNVPRRDLGKGRAIRVKFSYGWEEWDGGINEHARSVHIARNTVHRSETD